MVLLARGSVTVTAVNDGVPEKLYRAWSNNADGSGFSTTDSSGKYLGTYVGLSEPTLASQYKWTLIKGETGQPGVSAYLHTAWANSANGQTGFSTSVSTDKLYIGTYSSSSSTPSQAYTSYKWVRVKGLDAKFYSVIVDKSFLNRNGLSSTATETIAINSYVHEGNSAGVAAPGFFIIKEQIKETTGSTTTYVFQEKHRSTTAVSQLNYTVSANAVTVKIEFYLTNQFNNLFAVRDIGVLMDASTDIQARVPIAQLIENINNHPSTTRISGAKMHFTNDVTFDQSFHTKLFAQTGFIENLGAYEFSADNIKTGTLSSANGMSTMNLTTGAFSFAGGKLKYDGTTLSVTGSLTVDSFAPALKTSFNGKVDTSKLANSGQVTIHGGNITAGTLTADKITTGTLDASKVTVENLNATNITAGTLDVGKLTLKNLSASDIQAGTLDASKVTVKNLNATNITAGTLDVGILNLKNLSANDMQQGTLDANNVSIVNLSATSIKTGTLDASSVTIDNLSANYIKGGSLDLSKGLTISDGVNDILSIGADGKVALRASSINIGILPVATKKDVDDIALTPGPQGTSITSVTEWYLATSAATGVTTSTAGWDKTMRTMTTTNKYLWNYKVINYSEGSPQTTAPVIIGVYGTTGATGRSINSVTKHYLATSASSGIVRTNSSFTQTIQSTTPTNKYLWTYETITWNVAPLTTYVDPFIIGTHGEKGEVGTTGVGLQSITEWYLATPLKEGVTRTTSGWKESVQTLSNVNNYLWNYEQVNYDNGTKHYTDPTIIGTFGEQGISVKGVTEYYLASPLSEGITKDTPGWTTDIQPLTPENKYLWNKEIVHYSDDAAFLDKTDILSGTEIFTDKADENAIVHVEIDGKSVGVGNNNLLSKGDIQNWNRTITWNGDVSVIETASTGGLKIHHSLFDISKEYVLGFKAKLISGTINGIRGHSSSFDTTAYQDDVLLGLWAGSVTAVDKPLTVGAISEFKILFNKKAPTNDWLYIQPNRTAYGEPFKVELFDFQINEGSTLNKYEGLKPTPSHPIEIHSLNDFDVVSSVGKENLLTLSKKDEETTGAREFVNSSKWDLAPIFDKYGADINYTISFDIKSKVAGNINVYAQNGSSSRYSIGSYGLSVATEYKRISVTVKPTLVDVNESRALLAFFGSYDSGRIATIKNVKVEIGAGSESNDFTPSPLTINSGDKLDGIDKINLLLDEPLRSAGDVKDRLFRDSDGLWKVERNVGSWTLNGTENWIYEDSSKGYYSSLSGKLGRDESTTSIFQTILSSHFNGVRASKSVLSLGEFRIGAYANIIVNFDNGVGGKVGFNNWLMQNNVNIMAPLSVPVIENLPIETQNKLNNLRTFKESNYVYTILPDKSNILSENLKPTLHSTFKSKAWAGNFARYPSIIGVYGDSAKLLYLSTSADSMTFNSDGSANPASQTITFTGNLQNVLGNVLFTAIAHNGTTVVSTISLSGVGNTRTLTQAQFPASADRVQVKATLGNLEDTVTIVKLKNGADAIVGYLTNESVTLSANNAGTVSSFGSASGTFKVFKGTIDRTSSSSTTFRVKTQTGAVATINSSSGVYAVSSMSSDTANIVFEATYKNVKIDQTLSLSKSKEGAQGNPGNNGIPGKDGVGIKTTTITYASSTSGTATPASSSFTSTVPTVAPGDYLWTRTIWTYTDNSTEAGYTVSRIGKDGNTGSNGIPGKDGVGISNTLVEYVGSASGTVKPTTGYTTAVPVVSPGNYLWTRTTWTYTDSSKEYGYSAARMGENGPQGVSITKVDVQYYLSTSNTSQVGGSWSTTAPDWIDGRFMWSKTVTTYTSGSPTESKPVCITGAKGSTGGTGSTGATGRGISTIVEQFYLSNSKDAQTGGSWSTAMPTWSPGKYVWTRSLITYTTGTPATSTTEPLVSSEWEAINELEIGGRNMVRGERITSFPPTYHLTGLKEILEDKTVPSGWFMRINNLSSSGVSPSYYFYSYYSELYTENFSTKQVTLSFYLRANVPFLFDSKYQIGTEWTKVVINTPAWTTGNLHLYVHDVNVKTLDISSIKIEKGNKATDWSPAPEDVTASIKAAQDKANAASQEAIAAQADATVGKNMADNLSNDSVITQVEKLELKREWDAIVKEKPSITIQATDYALQGSTEATAYNTAYTALNDSIPTLLSKMNETSPVNRTTFNTNFANYYDKRQLLLNRIAKKAKELADVAQSSVDNLEVGGRNLIVNKNITEAMYVQESSGNLAGASTHAVTDFIPVILSSNYILSTSSPKNLTQIRIAYYTSAKVYISGALYSGNQGSSKQITTPSNAAFVRWSGDNVTSSKLTEWMFEKGNKASSWTPSPEDIEASYTAVAQTKAEAERVKAETYADGKVTAEEAARILDVNAKLAAAKKHAEDQILADKTIKDTRNDNQTPAWYYTNHKRQTIKEFKLTSTIGVVSSEGTYGILETEIPWTDASGGPVKQTFRVNSKTFKRSGTTTSWSSWVSYDDIAETAKSDAATAKGIADGAASSASAANGLLADIASDSVLTPGEKKNTKKEWDIIVGEKPKIDASADTYSITTQKTAYTNAYNALNTYLTGSGGLLVNLNIKSAIVGTTFRNNFKNYYNARQDLLNAISNGAKALVDGIEIGGTNLIKGSATPITMVPRNSGASSDNFNFIQMQAPMKSGETYTLSFDAEITHGSFSALDMYTQYGHTSITRYSIVGGKVVATFIAVATTDAAITYVYAGQSSVTRGNGLIISNYKLEKGNKATGWSPAPEDLYQYVDEVEIGGENLFAITDTVAGYTTNGNITSSTEVHRSMNSLIDVGDTKSLIYQIWNPNKTTNAANSNRVAFFTEANVFISAINIPYINGSTYQMLKFEVPTDARKARLAAIMGTGTIDPLIKIKFEKGNKATDWSPASGDVQSSIDGKADQSGTSTILQSMQDALDIALQEKTAAGLQNELSEFIKNYNKKQADEAKEKIASENRLKSIEERPVFLTTHYQDMTNVKTFIDRTFFEGEDGLMIKNGKEGTHILINDQSIDFFSNGTKTAYISQNKLSISDGTFIENLQIGNISASNETSKNHLTFRYTPPS